MNWIEVLNKAIDAHMILGITIIEDDLEVCQNARVLYSEYNEKYYAGELPEVDIVINPLSSTDLIGLFKSDGLKSFGYGIDRPAIIICPRLIRSTEDLKTVVLHEMAHEYCWLHNIQDVVKGGGHTIDFAKVCMDHGLTFEKGETNCSNTVLC